MGDSFHGRYPSAPRERALDRLSAPGDPQSDQIARLDRKRNPRNEDRLSAVQGAITVLVEGFVETHNRRRGRRFDFAKIRAIVELEYLAQREIVDQARSQARLLPRADFRKICRTVRALRDQRLMELYLTDNLASAKKSAARTVRLFIKGIRNYAAGRADPMFTKIGDFLGKAAVGEASVLDSPWSATTFRPSKRQAKVKPEAILGFLLSELRDKKGGSSGGGNES